MPIYTYSSMSLPICSLVTGTVSIKYSIGDWTIHLWIFRLTCGVILLLHSTPVTFLHLLHPRCVSCSHLHCSERCFTDILTRWLVEAEHIVSFGFLSMFHSDSCSPSFSWHFHEFLSSSMFPSMHWSSSTANTSSPVCTQHDIIREHQGASFLMLSVSESFIKPNRKGLKADHWYHYVPS